jgi:uncharacterized protein (TIGR03067 family)
MKLHVLVLGSALMLLGAGPAADQSQKELVRFQGVWIIASSEQDGRSDPSSPDTRVIISADEFTTKMGNRPLRRGTLKLDATKQPKTIDLTYIDGPQKGQSSLGIYRLEGDSWVLAFSIPGKARPTSFDHRIKAGIRYMVLKREEQVSKGK